MGRRAGLLLGGLAGALVGLVVGWLLLRPSAVDLLDAALDLVPAGFVVDGQGVDEGNVLLGWEDVAGVVAHDGERAPDDVRIEDLARAEGWTVPCTTRGPPPTSRCWDDRASRPGSPSRPTTAARSSRCSSSATDRALRIYAWLGLQGRLPEAASRMRSR